MLQTAEYARSIFMAGGNDETNLERAMASRLQRQDALYESHKRFLFLISEGGLRIRRASTTAMVQQYHHLVTVSTLHNVVLGIVPFNIPLGPLSGYSAFDIYDGRLATFDTPIGLMAWTWPEVISSQRDAFDDLLERSLQGAQARSFLVALAAELMPDETVIDLREPGLNQSLTQI
jgi:hypothetical protein